MATVKDIKTVKIKLPHSQIAELMGADRIDWYIQSLTDESSFRIKTYSEKFVNKLCDE